VAKAVAPDYALGPHVAPLGLVAAQGNTLPARFVSGMFIGEHGSWNRKPHSGYKVVFVPFDGGKPVGAPLDVLTGFLSDEGTSTFGRPAGVTVAADGALLFSDDTNGIVYRVQSD
jgi:glucose/arabinose dehydrogenase